MSQPKGNIIYSLVARGKIVLADCARTTGNFQSVATRILEKIPSENGRMSYVYDDHNFHYIAEGGLVALCMADEAYGRRLPFQSLELILQRFRSSYGVAAQTAKPLQFNDDFGRTMQREMETFNTTHRDKLQKVREEIDGAKAVMVDNIDKILQRGEKLDLLVDKTEKMNQESVNFKKRSTKLKRSMWCKNVKLTILIVVVVLVVAFIIFLFACSGFKCTKS
eukprot:NODE_565_length_1289_cov_263.197581_g407_i0.p1 GENE.NODE_565_length_1289_cov_263.197581_g407_i0~~NODE_565_length_1289_cov_263.197581_g407_i0.p1  ORF type:complete len:222 (+),score=85.33 NODE_565_length_1289_cov_263.197581_g407_i0:72-737(+)